MFKSTNKKRLDKILSYIVRLIVWFSGYVKLLSVFGLGSYDEWSKGKKIKVLLVGYKGARNTGADASIQHQSLGLPPILIITALAKRIAKNIINQ